MTEPSLVFPADEFRGRVGRLQTQMRAQNLDALLLTTPADVFYVSGFLTRFWESPARPWFLIVPAAGDPVAVIPAIGAALMSRTWIRDIRTWNAPDPVDDGVSLLSATLNELVPNPGQVGVPMGLETHVRMPMADFDRVSKKIAPRAFVAGTSALQRVREVKSEAEVEKIRATAAIAGRVFEQIPVLAQKARSLDRLFRDFQSALLAEGADWVSYVAGGAGQGGYGDVISPAGPELLRQGDILMLDTGAVKDGYFCDFDRNYAIGPQSKATGRVQDALWEATEGALQDLRPGMLACDVHEMLVAELSRKGIKEASGRLGHGLGITLTEWPSFTPKDQTELRAGMVLTLEPGAIVEDEVMIVHEENLVLRPSGAELLSPRAPRQMPEVNL